MRANIKFTEATTLKHYLFIADQAEMFAEHLHVCLMTILENSPSGDGYDRKEGAIIAFIAKIFRPESFSTTEIKTQIKNLITSHLALMS